MIDFAKADQVMATAFRAALILLFGWIVLRVIWPNDLTGVRLADHTLGSLVITIVRLLAWLWMASVLFFYLIRPRGKRTPFGFRDTFWIYTGLVVFGVIGLGLIVAAQQPAAGGAMAKAFGSLSNFLWWLIL